MLIFFQFLARTYLERHGRSQEGMGPLKNNFESYAHCGSKILLGGPDPLGYAPAERGPGFETQYKWNPFKKLMIP